MHALTSVFSQRVGLLLLRVTAAGLIFWWGLVKGLNTGTGTAVSNTYYGGMFSQEMVLIIFGWAQVLLALLVALGLFRQFTLPLQLLINAFVAVAIWQSFIDPFWLWMAGDKPDQVNALFYPSIIVVAACWVLIAFRHHDTIALDAFRRT